MQIRLATEDDVQPLARLFAESVRAVAPSAYTPAQVAAWAAMAEKIDTFRGSLLRAKTFVAGDESGLLGFCGLADDGHITSLYVRPDRLREGIATRLLEVVTREAQACGISRLYSEASLFSLPVFLKHGFHVTGTETVHRAGAEFQRHLVERNVES